MTQETKLAHRSKRGRFAQSNREALITLALYAAYFLWWYFFAYGLGDGDPAEYTYVMGFPAWFFYSCVLGCPLFGILVWITVRLFFRDMPLDAYLPDDTPDDMPDDMPDAQSARNKTSTRQDGDFASPAGSGSHDNAPAWKGGKNA